MLSTYDELVDFGVRSTPPSWATTAKKASIEKYLERGVVARMEDGALLRAVSAHQSQGAFFVGLSGADGPATVKVPARARGRATSRWAPR